LRTTVVVSHGGLMRVLRGLIEQLSPAATLALPVPQDRVLIIATGGSRWR
jgi:broad specificity phosphatase PhoE